MMKNKNLIPISALLTMGTIVMSNIQDEEKDELISTRELVGFLVLFTMLSAGADLGIPIAGGFAVLVMITILLMRGDKAFEFLVGKTEKSKMPKQKKKKPKKESGFKESGSNF